MMIWAYNIAMMTLLFFGLPLILPYLMLSPKRRPVLLQRLGIVLPRSIPYRGDHTEPIWVHALSVGEILSTTPLINALGHYYPDRPIVLSASTMTGYTIALEKLGPSVDGVFYFPYDLLFTVKRVIDSIRPSAVILIETDIWPNFLFALKHHGVPAVLANAKLSHRSFCGYRRTGAFGRKVFSSFSAIGCQSRNDAERFRRLGISEDIIKLTGNIKFDQSDTPMSRHDISALRTSLGIGRHQAVWVAGSTHAGEESVIKKAFVAIKTEKPDLTLIVAPRHPVRAGTVSRIFRSAGFEVAFLSDQGGRVPQRPADVIVIDTLGMLKKLYALADVALVGGSLVDIRGIGGHNPLEPAAFGKPILFGPHMHNFRDIATMLTAAGGAIQVSDAETLHNTVVNLLGNRHQLQRVGKNAHRVFEANKGAVARTIAIITSQLTPGQGLPEDTAANPPQGT